MEAWTSRRRRRNAAPAPARRRRRKPPRRLRPIRSPPPEEPTAILYGDMRDVGGRVKFSASGSTGPTPATSSRTIRSAGCTASPTTTARRSDDLFDKSIKCLKAGTEGDTAGPPSTTPFSLSHALARRGGPRRSAAARRSWSTTPWPRRARDDVAVQGPGPAREIARAGAGGRAMWGRGGLDASVAAAAVGRVLQGVATAAGLKQ